MSKNNSSIIFLVLAVIVVLFGLNAIPEHIASYSGAQKIALTYLGYTSVFSMAGLLLLASYSIRKGITL